MAISTEVRAYDQPTSAPVPKIQAVGIAGATVTLVLLIGTAFGIDLREVDVNAVAVGISALVTIVTTLAGYFKRDKKPVTVIEAIKEVSTESLRG